MAKRLTFTIIGIIFIALGVALCIESGNTGGLDAFHHVLSKILSVSFGTAVIIFGVFLLSILLILDLIKGEGFKVLLILIPLFLLGPTIDVFTFLIPDSTDMIFIVIYLLLGIITIGFGAALSIYGDLFPTIIDKFTVFLMKSLKLPNFTAAKLLFEGICAILAIILGLLIFDVVEYLTIATPFIIFGIGWTVDIFTYLINKIENK